MPLLGVMPQPLPRWGDSCCVMVRLVREMRGQVGEKPTVYQLPSTTCDNNHSVVWQEATLTCIYITHQYLYIFCQSLCLPFPINSLSLFLHAIYYLSSICLHENFHSLAYGGGYWPLRERRSSGMVMFLRASSDGTNMVKGPVPELGRERWREWLQGMQHVAARVILYHWRGKEIRVENGSEKMICYIRKTAVGCELCVRCYSIA